MKILLAEDDRDMAKGISVFLGRNHYTVDTVDNGTDAYDYLSGGDYNMAVLDIMMPGMSGIEVLKKIRKEGNKIPVLLLTAMGEVEDRIDGLDAGADDYLPKPFDAGELLARVKALLRRVENYAPDILEAGDLKLDRNSCRLSCGRNSVSLNLKSFQVMEMLMLGRGRIISTNEFMDRLPKIQQMVYKDLTAIYNGDPSAKTCTEIILSFPGFLAILFHRIAHEFYELDVPILPRLISEHVHEKTGIDIHPGAKIGESFCIDHGTGVVIGETAVIGDHVRIYHGVTLGVRNFRKDEDGNLLKGGKRHPNIGNRVIIYANATILGGDTFIKDDSVIPAGSMILHTPETFL